MMTSTLSRIRPMRTGMRLPKPVKATNTKCGALMLKRESIMSQIVSILAIDRGWWSMETVKQDLKNGVGKAAAQLDESLSILQSSEDDLEIKQRVYPGSLIRQPTQISFQLLSLGNSTTLFLRTSTM